VTPNDWHRNSAVFEQVKIF